METDRTRLVDSGFHDTKSETEEIAGCGWITGVGHAMIKVEC